MVADWYKSAGYHFLVPSEHNILQEGNRWADANHSRLKGKTWETVLTKYRKRFGPDWVREKNTNGKQSVRIMPLSEYAPLFNEPGRFLLIPGEEITPIGSGVPGYMGAEGDLPQVDINVTNVMDVIPPQGGIDVGEVVRKNIDLVREQRERTGRSMLAHIPHPNYRYALTAEVFASVQSDPVFFEVYNGGGVLNYGDEHHVSTERMWDIALTLRLSSQVNGMLYGIAVDDTHHYHQLHGASPGRGWIMARAAYLTPESIVRAMERGDFYASTGVRLDDIQVENSSLRLKIDPEAGTTFLTQFIGTREGYDPRNEPRMDSEGNPIRTTRRYSAQVGAILAETDALERNYVFKGDELYVRANVTSSKLKENPHAEGDYECAWTQPVKPPRPDSR